jgi:hypothetical protein
MIAYGWSHRSSMTLPPADRCGGMGETPRAREDSARRCFAEVGTRKWARATYGPIRPNPWKTVENSLYCLLYTIVLFTAWPLAFVPVWVMVRVLPSAETTSFAEIVTFPPFFQVLL